MPENIGNLSFSFAFPQKFCDLYNEYRDDPLKLEMLNVEGIAPDNMDIPVQSKKFFKNRVADVSIDANANANSDDVDNKNPSSYTSELEKGMFKLQGYYLMWRELEKEHGSERASELMRRVWDGDLYIHDASGAMIQTYYCYAFSTQKIMYEGRPWGQLHSVPPKRADSFMAEVSESVMDMSQQQAGAVAITDIIVNLAYYAKKENLSDKKVLNELQKFIHIMNNKFRISFQSVFCNISLFDRNNLRVLFDGYTYPDFTPVDVEYVMHLQSVFLDFFSKGDPSTGLPYRFPVVTATYLNDADHGYPLDDDFLKDLCKATFKNGATNIYISNDMGKIASCCFSGDTMVNYAYELNTDTILDRSGDQTGFYLKPFKDAYEKDNDKIVYTKYRGKWNKSKLIRVPYTKSFIKITTDDGETHRMTYDHLNPTPKGDIRADMLRKGDLILYRDMPEARAEEIDLWKDNLSGDYYTRVTDTTIEEQKDGYAYCFEVLEGEPYFQLASGMVTHNCRLINDFKLLKGGDSFGNGGQIGSHRVVTINLPSISLFAKGDKEVFKTLLNDRLNDTHDLLKAHRSLINKRAKNGFIPFVNRGYIDINTQLFSTVGLNGVYEAMLFLTGEKMHEHAETESFAKEIFKGIKQATYRWIDEEGLPYNIEQVPAESLAPKNAYKDALRFGADAQPLPLYSNQFIPLWVDVDIHTRARMDGEFSKSLTGGGITHFNMDQPFASAEEMYNSVLYNIKVGNEHFAYNFNRQICEDNHVTIGHNQGKCPECGKPIVDNFTRIVGYFVPVSSWNKIRREIEHGLRVFKN